MNIRWIFLISFVFLVQVSNAQEDDLLTLDVQKIISLPNKFDYTQEIVSASKKSERLFEAPLSASVLTKEEIIASGAPNIMEALRLVSGVIVRKVTNGSYNIHIRGMDWLPHNTDILAGQNQLTLVMIDDRPVYSYSIGTTLWNTLPVQLSDIERIEVIRGGAASLFGANAVTGAINIITAKPKKEGTYGVANVQLGSFNATVADMAIGYQFKEKFHVVASAHKAYQERTTNHFFDINSDTYKNIEDIKLLTGENVTIDLGGTIPSGYNYPNVALDKMTGNITSTYYFDNEDYIDFKLGYNKVKHLKTLYNAGLRTLLAKCTSEDYYLDMSANIQKIKAKFSYLKQNQNLAVGLYEPYDATLLDTYLSYEWDLNDFIQFTPSLGYRYAHYEHQITNDGSVFSFEEARKAVINNWDTTSLMPKVALQDAFSKTFQPPIPIMDERRKTYLVNSFVALRADNQFLNQKLRIITAIRLDQFNNLNNRVYPSYQFSSTYSFSKNHLVRGRIAKSYASNYLIHTQVSAIQSYNVPFNGQLCNGFVHVKGNSDLKPIEQQMIEVGYRGKLKDKLAIDFEAFYSTLKNQRYYLINSATLKFIGAIPVFELEAPFKNFPMIANQIGVTISLNYYIKKLSIKPFLTWQQTQIKKHSSHLMTPEFTSLNPIYGDKHYLDTKDIRHKATPNWYGGLNINFKPISKWNIGLHTYFMSKQEFYASRKSYDVGNKIIGNIKLGYHLNPQVTLFSSVRDITNTNQAEYFYTDPIQTSYWVGLNFNLK